MNTDNLCELLKTQFLHTSEKEYNVELVGEIKRIRYKHSIFKPIFWILEKYGILIFGKQIELPEFFGQLLLGNSRLDQFVIDSESSKMKIHMKITHPICGFLYEYCGEFQLLKQFVKLD